MGNYVLEEQGKGRQGVQTAKPRKWETLKDKGPGFFVKYTSGKKRERVRERERGNLQIKKSMKRPMNKIQ